MAMAESMRREDEQLLRATLRFNSKLLGLTFGFLFGLAIFVATNWLILKGGHVNPDGQYVVGPHLRLLNQFFLGYRITFFGSIVGFAYGFAFGTITGSTIGWIHNKIAELRSARLG